MGKRQELKINDIIIPESFELMGREIKVVIKKDLYHDTKLLGQALYKKGEILLQGKSESYNINEDSIENAFYHELVHWIFYALGDYEKNRDEKLVHQIGGLIHQFIKNAKF